MTSTLKLLDKYKASLNLKSDNAAAEALGVQRSAVSKWRVEEGHAGPAAVMKMCDATGEQLQKWLPQIESERAKGADKKAWLRIAQAAAMITLVLSFGRLDVQASTTNGAEPAAHNPVTLYIMSNIARAFRRVGTRLASLCTPCIGRFGYAL